MGKTLAQKIFDAHLVDKVGEGVSVLSLDRVFCHEITTPIAINDLVSKGLDRVFDPTKIKAGAVANPGIAVKIGAKKMASKNKMPVTTEAKPVRAPAPTPAELST